MSKLEKKKSKLLDRIKFLEDELTMSLTKKDSNTKEIDVPTQMKRIQDLKLELRNMK
jgi:hypothetical protein